MTDTSQSPESHLIAASSHLRAYLEAQGFGHESVVRVSGEDLSYLTQWLLEPSSPEQLAEGQAIISFAFGYGPKREGIENPPEQYYPEYYEPGASNEALARVIADINSDRQLPIYAQWEVAEALANNHGMNLPLEHVARPDGKYLGTSGVVRQWLRNGLGEDSPVILVAHPYHVFRCREVTSKVSADNGNPLEVVVPDTRDVPFDPRSEQPWTRSLEQWVSYEVGARFANRYSGHMGTKI